MHMATLNPALFLQGRTNPLAYRKGVYATHIEESRNVG